MRRRRNDVSWANPELRQSQDEVSRDLLACWGIGPAKATQEGFGWELAVVLGENEAHLATSRKLRSCSDARGVGLVHASDETGVATITEAGSPPKRQR